MSSSHGSLPEFAAGESIRFVRLLVATMVLVCVISLPATVVVLGLLPAASGHLVVAMASLVLVATGALDGTAPAADDRSRDSTIRYDEAGDAIVVFAVVYAVFAGSFSSVLVASASLGYLVAGAGFPTVGLVAAAGAPFFDRRLAGIDARLSIVDATGKLMEYLLRGMGVVHSLPSSLGEDVREQRRNIY